MRIARLALSLSLFSLIATAPAAYSADPEQPKKPHVVDVAGDFLTFWNGTQNLGDKERVQKFLTKVASKAPDLYYKVLFDYWDKVLHTNRDERIAKQIKEFPSIKARYRQVYNELSGSMKTYLDQFQKRFPDFKLDNVDIYIAHSMGGSNGAAVPLDGRTMFYLGVDMIAIHNNYPHQKPFFDHEFFHVYHLQKYKLANKFYARFWMEGLATYVSKQMNPDATNAELMLDETMVARTKLLIPELAKDVLDNLEAEDKDLKLKFKYFDIESKDKTIPPRAGYYLAYLLVQEIAKDTTLEEMATWQEQEIVPRMRQALRELSHNPDMETLFMKAETILVVEFSRYQPHNKKPITFRNPPTAYFHIEEHIKGAPLSCSPPVRFDFTDNPNTPAPAGWKFNDSLMPRKGSKWIIFIPNTVPNDGQFETYHGSAGRLEYNEANIDELLKIIEKYKGANR